MAQYESFCSLESRYKNILKKFQNHKKSGKSEKANFAKAGIDPFPYRSPFLTKMKNKAKKNLFGIPITNGRT